MTAKSSVTNMLAELAELRGAIANAKIASGETQLVIANDPESEELLREYRIESLDQKRTLEIGPAELDPGWYESYAAATKAGDVERSRELLGGARK
jgi:hypothetical protein